MVGGRERPDGQVDEQVVAPQGLHHAPAGDVVVELGGPGGGQEGDAPVGQVADGEVQQRRRRLVQPLEVVEEDSRGRCRRQVGQQGDDGVVEAAGVVEVDPARPTARAGAG